MEKLMKVISKSNKAITIDGIAGIVHQEEDGSYLFVSRDEGAIDARPISAHYIKYNPKKRAYTVREKFRDSWGLEDERHYPFFETWAFSYPNGKYMTFDRALIAAGIPYERQTDV